MEVSGAVIRQSIGVRLGGAGSSCSVTSKRRDGARQKAAVSVRRWSDEGHSLYYASSSRCSGVRDTQRKEVMRIAAFGTDLSRELAALYSTGLGMNSEELIGGEIRGEMIKEASELLLVQLSQKKSKEKEMKRRNKEADLKSQKMLDCADESSSSSSSESSDSECEEVIDPKKNLKGMIPKSLDDLDQSSKKTELTLMCPTLKIDCTSLVGSCSNVKPLGKIEVCMGGKCKKSGAVELMRELEKKVGISGAVIGCKCMGKCKQGPNVRIMNHGRGSPEVELAKKTLCLGVGLGDVGAIASNFLRQSDGGRDMSLLAP